MNKASGWVAVFVVLLGCTPTPSASTPTTVMPGSETAATFSAASPSGPATMVVQSNGGSTVFMSAWSEDGSNWHPCDLFSCGYGGPMPVAVQQGNFRGDPAVAAGLPGSGIVMAANIADRAQPYFHQNGLVVVSMSIDGGRNWISTQEVNPYGSGDGCDEGGQDQEDLSYDPTTDTFWVAWRTQAWPPTASASEASTSCPASTRSSGSGPRTRWRTSTARRSSGWEECAFGTTATS